MPLDKPLPEDEAAANEVETPAAGTKERQPTPRELDMQLVEARRTAEFTKETGVKAEDLAYIEQEPSDPDADPADAEAEEARKKLEAEAAATDAETKAQIAKQTQTPDEPPLIEDPTKHRVKVRIDGEERIVSLADAVRNYQKDEAADKRLRDATLLLQEAGKARPEPKEEPKPEPKAEVV